MEIQVQAYVWLTKEEFEVYLTERKMQHFLDKMWEEAEKQYDEFKGELTAKIRER